VSASKVVLPEIRADDNVVYDLSLWVSFEEEIAMFFSAWHFPTLKAEYHHFFEQSRTDKMTTPLANLSIYLMISALGIMMRASQKEIFGSAPQGSALCLEEVDLTCSRLQSELYRELKRGGHMRPSS
jgi:hypothetical protein